MNKLNKTNFPDDEYLNKLVEHTRDKVNTYQTPLEQLVIYCSASMNWIADYITDENIMWSLETISTDKLYLTGTNPKWNSVIIEQCKRSPNKLQALIKNDPAMAKLFSEATFEELPILVRYDEDKYKVLDGMHRTIAAIREDKKTIQAFVAKPKGDPKPKCEPHVVYDLLKAYHRKINQDRQGLITALRFLRHSYANVEELLKNRFNKSWLPDDEIQEIIQEALKD